MEKGFRLETDKCHFYDKCLNAVAWASNIWFQLIEKEKNGRFYRNVKNEYFIHSCKFVTVCMLLVKRGIASQVYEVAVHFQYGGKAHMWKYNQNLVAWGRETQVKNSWNDLLPNVIYLLL